jgi:predicted metal-dependent peptidase
MEGKTQEEMKELSEEIDEALRHGGLLAGRFGVKVPRVITDMLEPKVDWKRVLAEFVTNSTKGNDEYTWRRFNRHRLADDNYLPSVEDETVGEIIYAVDTSGSMTQAILNEGSGELASICQSCEPEKVRVLWWDTKVHGEQVFSENYDNLRKLLKPQGGGGTRVSCVSEYLTKKTVKADCIIIFTDGYLESGINWDTNVPTLWLVTSNKSFVPPRGQMVYIDNN